MAVPWLALAGLAIQLGGSIYSGVKSKQANDKAEEEAKRLEQKQDEMYRRQLADAERLQNENYLDTAEAKGLITELQNQYKDVIKNTTANGMKRELTDEAKLANTQQANEMYTDSLGRIAQSGTGYRLGLLNMANALKSNAMTGQANTNYALANMRVGFANSANQSAMNAASNGADAFTNLIGALGEDGGGKTQKNTGGNSTVATSTNGAQTTITGVGGGNINQPSNPVIEHQNRILDGTL
jgi:chromosomal replication initiation ATPase DnaA